MKTMLTRSIMILALAALALPLAAQADLGADIAGLAKYQFGSDRTALSNVQKAVDGAVGNKDKAALADLEKRLSAAIQGECSLEGERFACRMLHEFGGEASVPALAGLLKSADTFQAALTALETNRSEAATKALITAAKDAKGAQQLGATASLGRQGGEKAVPALKELLSSADDAVAGQAAEALAFIGKPGCSAVAEALKAAPAEKKALFTPPCLQCALDENNGEWLALLNGAGFPAHVRIAALGGLLKADPAKAPGMIVAALNDADVDISRVALGLARKTEGAEITEALCKAVAMAAPDQQAALLNVLGARGDKTAVDAAKGLADSADNAVAVAALRALGKLGDDAVAPFLVAKAAAGKGDIKTVAQEALSVLRGEKVDAVLVDLAGKDGDAELRAQALRSLADRRAIGSRAAVLKLASDKNDDVAAEAVKSLRALAQSEDVPALIALLNGAKEGPQQDGISRTIMAVCERNADAGKRADQVIAAFDKASKPEQQAALVAVLGGIGTKTALETLRAKLAKADPAVRAAIVDAYSVWPTAAAADDLLAVLKAPKDDKERGRAFSGYIGLLRKDDIESAAAVCARFAEAAQLAKDKGEKRSVLSGVANVGAPEALALVDEMGKDEELAAESQQAVLRIAKALCGADPQGIRERLEKLMLEKPDVNTVKTVNEVSGMIARFEDYISAWEYAGPYFEEGKSATQLFDVEFPPEKGDKDVGWRVFPFGTDDSRGWVILLDKVLGGEERVVYLRTRIFSPEARDSILELGTNDGCKVWFNGQKIHAVNEGRPLQPGQDKLALKLDKGWNTLMVAVYQQGGAWSASARITQPDGKPSQGLRFSVREN